MSRRSMMTASCVGLVFGFTKVNAGEALDCGACQIFSGGLVNPDGFCDVWSGA